MPLKHFDQLKLRKKDGMPYGFTAPDIISKEDQLAAYDLAKAEAADRQNLAELRKARNDPSMQRLLNSQEYQDRQKAYSQRALELAQERANAGGERVTETRKPQTVSVNYGFGTLPNPMSQGMNTAANGADIDYTKINKRASKPENVWKGLGNSQEETISQEDALKNATATVEPYIKDKEVKQILDRYVEVSNAHDQAKATTGLRWFKNIDKAMWGSTLDEPKQQLIEKTGLSDEEADKLLRHYKYYANNQLHEEQRKAIDELPTSVKVALTPLASMERITGNFLGGIAVKDSDTKDPELGRDYNSASFGFRNLGNDIKESLHEDINESNLADWQKTALNKGYDVGTMAGESFVTALYPGKVGLLSYGTGSYADNLQEAENRGLTKGQAQSYAATMGVAEVATEMIPFNHLSNLIKNGAGKEAVKGSLKPIFKEVLVQMNEEGTEELANDVIDVIADSLINQDKSKLNISINNYMAEGLSKDEATSKAYKDIALQAADDYLTGALSGGLSAGAAVGVYTGQTTSIGRDIAKNNEYLTKNTESPYYISENKEDYDSDASYEQAQATRQELMAAAEKLANKQKISGQEARAIYQDTTDVLENKRIQAENRAQRAAVEEAEAFEEPESTFKADEKEEYQAPLKDQSEVYSDIEFATTPYQLAKAIESVTDMTEELQDLIDYKKDEIKSYFNQDVEDVITPKKAFEMGQNGEEITEEQLKSIPEADRQEILENNNRQYNKAILNENPNAVADTSTGKYFVPKDVTTKGSEVVIVDNEGNEHTEFNNPRITAVENAFKQVSRDYNTGRLTNENLYNASVQQAAYAVNMAINSPEATAALLTTATQRIFDSASVGHMTWTEFKKQSHGLFTKIDEQSAEKLYNQVREDARKSDSVKSKNTEGKKTHNEVVSKTLRDNLDEASVALLEGFGKKIGYDFVASSNKNARGDINPSKRTISIGSNNLSELWSISTHEGIAEYLQAHGNAADVLALQDDMLKYLENKLGTNEYNNLINLYQSVYRTGAENAIDKGKSRRAAANEMFNDTVFALMSSEEGMNDFINWITENNTATEQVSILSRVKNFFSKIFDYIQNYINSGSFNAAEKAALEMDVKQAKEFRDRIFKLMDDAIENANSNISQDAAASDETRESRKVSINVEEDGTVVIRGRQFSAKDIKKNYSKVRDEVYKSLLNLIGNSYVIKSDNRTVYVAPDLAREFTGSNDTWDNNRTYRGRKANIVNGIEKLIINAKNPVWTENTEEKHNIDAKRGWTYYDVVFAFEDLEGNRTDYIATLNIRMDADGKDYVYDITKHDEKKKGRTGPKPSNSNPSDDLSISFESDKSIDKLSKNGEKAVNNARKSKSIGDIEQEAIKHFGTTDNFRVAGYMLADGSMLDFSGAHWLEGESPEYIADWKSKNDIRQVDHEDITEVFDDDDAYNKFVDERGNIRLMPESPGVSISSTVEPTAAQYRQLKEFIREAKTNPNYNNYDFFVDVGAKNPKKLAYRNNINEDRVINDIKKYYETGEVSQNALNDFRYSIKVDTNGRELSEAQQKFYADEDSVFTEDGSLKVYYHGSQNAGFTKFMMNRADDGISLFVTDSLNVAKGYSGTHDIFDPDAKWEYEKLDQFLYTMTWGDLELDRDGDKFTITDYGNNDEVTTFDTLAEAQKYAVDYANGLDLINNNTAANYQLYVHSTNPLVVDAENNQWNELPVKNYAKHYQQINISKDGNNYNVEYQDGKAFKNETFESLKSLEEKFGKLYENFEYGEVFISDLYLDKNGQRIPTNTREYAQYAKDNGYDAVVFNNIYDTAIFNSSKEIESSQVVAVFNSNQVKSVYNENPSVENDDIRKSIKVDWDNKVVDIPARNFDDEVFLKGTDEEIAAAEKQEATIKAYYANLINSKGFKGLTFSWEDGRGDLNERILTRSTREGVDWQYSKRKNGLPVGHDNFVNENDDIFSYATWPNNTLAALYNELLVDTPKDGQRVYVIREGAAENARNSIKVYGEASPYADSINETKVIQTMLGSMNSALSQADAFEVPNDTYLQIEKNILKKYNSNLEEGELAANIAYAFAYMSQNKLDTNYESMMNYLLNIGDEVIKNSNLKDPESVKTYDDAKNILKSYTFKLSDQDRAEIKHVFGGNWQTAFGELNKAAIKLNNNSGVDVDTVFTQLQSEFLQTTGINLEKFDKPSEQILGILDSMNALEPTAYLWDGANDMDKALTVAADIINAYYSNATGQLVSNVVKGTKKGNEKITQAINKEKAKLNQRFNEYKANKTDEFEQMVAEKNRIIQEQQNQIRQQNDMMRQWNRDLSEKDKQLQQQKVLSEKQIRQNARLEAQKAVQSYKEREERARQIENIRKSGIRMIKWLTSPTDAQHVPAFLEKPLAEFLSAIDFLPTNAKANSKNTLTWQQRMNDLRQELIRIKDAEADGMDDARAYFAQNIVAKEVIAMLDDFLGKESWDEATMSYIVTKRAAKKVSLLDAAELAKLDKIMSALSASINNMNKTYANSVFKNVSDVAKASANEIDELPAKKDMQRLMGTAFNFLNFDELEPITYFEGLGKGAKSIFDELREGFNVKTKHVKESDEYMAKAKKDLSISDAELSKWKYQVHTFKLFEGEVMLNTNQIMSLYEILKRKQGKPHVAVGGIKAADFDYKVDGKFRTKKHHQAKAVHIMSSEAQAIINTLTDEQKALADKMQQYMASECASWGNRVTEKMFGYKKYEEKDYFPLKTDAHSRATTASSDNNVSYYSIKNSSFTKPITPMANNAVVLDDIFDVFTDHVVQMADYDAYVMPIADAMRWFNYSEKVINAVAPDELNEVGARVDYLGNMQESIDRVYGDAGLKYFRQFIKDINGDYAGKGGKSEVLNKLMSMYKAQAVGANVRVVIQQPTAVIRAADVIESKYLLEAMTSLPMAIKYAEKAQANSEIAYWKAQGYYETYLGQSFKEIITGDTTLKDKITDFSGKAAGLADDLSWGIMYHAAELKVKKLHPELKQDSAAFNEEVKKIFEDVIDHTQVVDTIFHKSQWMRSQELGHKMTSAFMAEPTKTYNMLYRAFRNAKLKKDKKALRELSKVALIFLVEQMVNALVTASWDSLRDEEKENYTQGLKEHFKENAIDNLILLNLIPITKDVVSFFNGYDATSYVYDGLESLVSTFTADKKYVNKLMAGEKPSKTPYGISYQNAKAISQLTGVPISNIERDAVTIYNAINDMWGGEDIVKNTSTITKRQKMQNTARATEVFDSNDLKAIDAEIVNTYNKAIESGKDESQSWGAARAMLQEQYKRQFSEHPEQAAALNNRYATLVSKTKHKVSGNYEYYTVEQAQKKYIDDWYGDMTN